MKKNFLDSFNIKLLSFLLTIVFLGCFGCSTRKALTAPNIQPDDNLAIYTEEIEISTEIPDSIYEIQQDPVSIDEMFVQAQQSIDEGDFNSADSVLREILQQIDQIPESDLFSVNEYFEAVLNIYTEQMPSELIKDDIAVLIFQNQMFESLDSSKFTSDDSSDLEQLHCRKNVTYDIPVVWNNRVKKALHYYLKNRSSTINNWLSRANLYLPVMKKMLADSGLPLDLAYLPLIESAFNPKAYSRAHASGIWQFIPSTGRIYGLRQNYWTDERRDPIKSTKAAIRYLKKLHNDFDDWYLALAAYNCGEGRVSRTIKRYDTENYWDLKLPGETMNYVPLYLASLIIAKNPQCFGYSEIRTDTLLIDTVLISECIDIQEIAKGIDCDPDTLRKLNPHILHWCTPPDMSNVSLYLPYGKTEDYNAFYSNLPDEKKVKWYRYRIRRGDNLISIARSFKLPVSAIKSVNRLSGNRIVAGRYLFIPIPVNSSLPVQKKVKTAYSAPAPVKKKGKKVTYKVKEGDTVWRLSEIFGVTTTQIYSWNNLKNARIHVGQILEIYQNTPVSEAVSSKIKSKLLNSSQSKNSQKSYHSYKVVSGDTPSSVARSFKMDINDLIEINGLDRNKPVIYAGDIIRVITSSQKDKAIGLKKDPIDHSKIIKYLVAPGDNLFRISQSFSVPLKVLLVLNSLTESSIINPGDTLLIPSSDKAAEKYKQTVSKDNNSILYYEIKQGDNLWNIASVFGISINKLYNLNNLNSNSVLMPGDTIKVIRTGQM